MHTHNTQSTFASHSPLDLLAARATRWPCPRRDALRRSDGLRAESQRALDGLRGEFEALTRELIAEGGTHASWSAASSSLPHGVGPESVHSTPLWHIPHGMDTGHRNSILSVHASLQSHGQPPRTRDC